MTMQAWTDDERELWARIAAHSFDDASRTLDFTARLARDQAWTRNHARAAIAEYRKFCFLALRAGHAVTPSTVVDAVWHLHLTYTRDYWELFCTALGRPLHHEPTAGGRAEAVRFRAQYADTLASYQRYFGSPPLVFWPPGRPRLRWRDTLLSIDPRRRLRTSHATWVFALSTALTATTAFALPVNPLDWSGGPFLLLYLALMFATLVVCIAWRRALRENGAGGSGVTLEPLEVAYLAGGRMRAVDAGVADLLSRTAVRWEGDRLVAEPGADVPASLHGLLRAVRTDGRPTAVIKRAATEFTLLRRTLQSRGLWLGHDEERRARWLPAMLPAALAAFGTGKILVGLARGRPVAFLVVLVIVTVIAGLVFAACASGRSRLGDRVLAQLKARHAHATRAPRVSDLPLAVALAGTSVLATTAWADYHRARAPTSSDSSSDSSSSSSGCSSGDGGGGGCGGCSGGD